MNREFDEIRSFSSFPRTRESRNGKAAAVALGPPRPRGRRPVARTDFHFDAGPKSERVPRRVGSAQLPEGRARADARFRGADKADFSTGLFPVVGRAASLVPLRIPPSIASCGNNVMPNPLSTICAKVWRLVASTGSICFLSASPHAASACSRRQCPSLSSSNPWCRNCSRSTAFRPASG